MIASVRGIIEAKGTGQLVVLVGGVGLRVLVPATVLSEAGDVGDPVHLLTHLQVREDALTLYGFSSADQLRLFELLISVTGVGPGHALGILSQGDAASVETAIATGNEAFIARAPRLGKKLAARVVLELRAKVAASDGAADGAGGAPQDDDVVAAIIALGWTPGEANAAASSVPADPTLTTEQKILLALAYFNRS